MVRRSYLVDGIETAVALEKLARVRAFYEFERQIAISLTVWLIDIDIRSAYPLRNCFNFVWLS